jgi:CRP-like cAMP-binding protein
MLNKSPQLTRAFLREMFVQAAIFREWVTNLGRREAIARVAHVVCELAVRLQAVNLRAISASRSHGPKPTSPTPAGSPAFTPTGSCRNCGGSA